jgi:putative transposase
VSSGDSSDAKELMQHERAGRPLGSADFVENVGRSLGRDLKKKKPGPKLKQDN